MLTKRQKDCLEYIKRETCATGGVSPSFEQIRAALGLANRSGVTRLIDALEERGYIRRLRYRARGIEVVSANPVRVSKLTQQRCVAVPVMGYID